MEGSSQDIKGNSRQQSAISQERFDSSNTTCNSHQQSVIGTHQSQKGFENPNITLLMADSRKPIIIQRTEYVRTEKP